MAIRVLIIFLVTSVLLNACVPTQRNIEHRGIATAVYEVSRPMETKHIP